jgi:sodium/proline symporter
MNTATLITFSIYLVGMMAIGVAAYKLTNNLSDYILGGRRLGSLVTALSAGASDMSGWLLLGLPGAIYASGLSEAWIGLGLLVGAYFNWKVTAPRLRAYTEIAGNSLTLSDFFTNRFADKSGMLRAISAAVIIVFFTVYVASGMTAGAKLFESSFEMDYQTALWLGAIVIVSYTFVGGFLAVSWTDVIQGILMALALVIAPIAMIVELNGIDQAMVTIAQLDTVSSAELAKSDWFAGKEPVSYLLSFSFISLMAWGLGYYGQPHLLVRFMAAKSVKHVHKARRIAMVWMLISMLGALFVGFFAIAYFSGTEHANMLALAGNHEKVFIIATQVLFNPWVAGFLLAAILAAVMSTIDSQLLVSSAAITEDVYRQWFKRSATEQELIWVGRISVLVVAFIAIIIAMDKESSVLGLVSHAWAGFGAAFGPVIVMSLVWKSMTARAALYGMITGAVVVIGWVVLQSSVDWMGSIYAMIPGVTLSAIVIAIETQRLPQQDGAILATFDQVQQELKLCH